VPRRDATRGSATFPIHPTISLGSRKPAGSRERRLAPMRLPMRGDDIVSARCRSTLGLYRIFILRFSLKLSNSVRKCVSRALSVIGVATRACFARSALISRAMMRTILRKTLVGRKNDATKTLRFSRGPLLIKFTLFARFRKGGYRPGIPMSYRYPGLSFRGMARGYGRGRSS